MQTKAVTKAYFLLLDEKWDEDFLSLVYELLDKRTVEKCRRKRKVQDRLASACAHLLVRKCVCSTCGIDTKSLEIGENEYGKPFFCKFPDIHFSISHTDGAVFAAVSDENIGVDIERITKARKSVQNRYFTEVEKEYCGQSDERFFEIWTKKEAYVKYTGKGLCEGLNTFCTLSDKKDMILSARQGQYVMSVCQEKPQNVLIETRTLEQMRQWAKQNI